MNNVIFLLSKDCMSLEALPLYGNKYWKTPNIDELAANGTVFWNHYTTAPSTTMAMSSMLTGHYPYEFKSRKIYTKVKPNEFESLYETFQKEGYETHLIWDQTWIQMAWRYVREYGDENKIIVHNLDIAQPVGDHKKNEKEIERDDAKLVKTYDQIFQTLASIDFTKKQFVWMHLPHVLKGRRSYMDDMDVFDHIVGHVRKLVGDDSIYLTTDHGHMNMHKGLVGYGFHVYEPSIHIPLITPRINDLKEIRDLTSHVDLPQLIVKKEVTKRDYVVCETAYYGQPHRVTAVLDRRYKYIYNKKNRTEELYDLEWDPEENYNILKDSFYDKSRRSRVKYDELYFYPYEKEAKEALVRLRVEKEKFWDDAGWVWELYGMARKYLGTLKKSIMKMRTKHLTESM